MGRTSSEEMRKAALGSVAIHLRQRAQPALQGSLKLGWPFRDTPKQATGQGFCASTANSCWMWAALGKGLHLRQGNILWLGSGERLSTEPSAANTAGGGGNECLGPEGGLETTRDKICSGSPVVPCGSTCSI